MNLDHLARILEAVKIIPLRKDDVIVFRTASSVSMETAELIRASLRETLGADRTILFLCDRADIEVIRPEECA